MRCSGRHGITQHVKANPHTPRDLPPRLMVILAERATGHQNIKHQREGGSEGAEKRERERPPAERNGA